MPTTRRRNCHDTLPDGWMPPNMACGANAEALADPFATLLTPTQRTIAAMVAVGRDHHFIANKLGISSKTVDTHRASILKRLGCSNNVELARLAIRWSRVPHPDAIV